MIVIADAGPLIHLYLVGASNWALPPDEIFVVREVWLEVERHAPGALNDERLALMDMPVAPVPADLLHLDPGEAAALSLALDHPGCIVLCDERAARSVCERLQIDVIGSIGLIVQSFREKRVDRAVAVRALHELPTRGRLHVSSNLIVHAIAALGTTPDPRTVVLRFNACINARDLDGLGSLITDDHTFIDSADAVIRGKESVLAAWSGFFEAFPDYANSFDQVTADGSCLMIAGRSTCSYAPLDGPALWTARVDDGKLAEWRVYEDTPEIRERLGLEIHR